MAAIRRALASDPAKTTDRDEADTKLRELDERLDRAEAALIRPTGSTTEDDDPVEAGLETLQQLEQEYEQQRQGRSSTMQTHDHESDDPEPADDGDTSPFVEADEAVQEVQAQVADISEQLRSWSAEEEPEADPEPEQYRSKREEMAAEAEAKRETEAVDRHARTKKRLARLGLVLVAATIVSPLLQSITPARAFAVASDSMAPSISRGSLAVAVPGEVEVGDVVVYESVLGANQIHRVQSVDRGGGTTYYTTRGDANEGVDAFSVPDGDVIGVVEGHVPYLGYLWMMSLEVQAGLFLLLVGVYLGIVFWDDRVLLRSGVKKLAAVALVLAILVPAGHGMVDVVEPAGVMTSNVNQDTPLPFYAGDVGVTNISDSRTRAAAGVGPPTVWKETVMWGCEPGGDCVLNQDATDTWVDYDQSRIEVDVADYDPTPTFVLEAVMDANGADEIQVRLINMTTGNAVGNSTVTTANTDPTRVRSPAIDLSGQHEYKFQVQVNDADSDITTGDVHMVKLLSAQSGATDTVTTVRISGGDQVSGGNLVTSERTAHWQYNRSAFDGNVSVYFEAVGSLPSGPGAGDATVEMVRVGKDNDVAGSVSFQEGDANARKRTGDISDDPQLVPGAEYDVEVDNNNALQTFSLDIARIIVEQDDLNRTVRYVDLSLQDTTSSTTFVDAGYPAVHNGSMEWGPVSGYFEATVLSDTTGEGVEARLTNASDGGSVIDDTRIGATTTSATRVRTGGQVTLNRSDTVYRPEIHSTVGTATAEIRNAWIVSYQDGGRTYDHVLENPHNVTGTGAWDVHLDFAKSTNLSRVENMTVGLRDGDTTNVTANLPSPRDRASAVWDDVRDVAYTFGGHNETTSAKTDEIVEFDPSTGETTVVARLPSDRYQTSAAWDPVNDVAYVFGGRNATDAKLDDVVKFDPATGSVSVVSSLPSARDQTSAVWDPVNDVAYVFGGQTSDGWSDDIVEFDPSTGSTSVVDSLPSARDETSAAWDATRDVAYLFAGWDDADNSHTTDIVEYDPASGDVTTLGASLPSPRGQTAATWDPVQEVAYVFGGLEDSESDETDRIVEFDPASGRVRTVSTRLPQKVDLASAVWDPVRDQAYVLGGDADFVHTDDIVQYAPHGTLQIQVDQGALTETPTSVRIEPGRSLQHVVHGRVDGSGRSSVVAELVATHRGTGLTFRQPVKYVLFGDHGAGAGGGSGPTSDSSDDDDGPDIDRPKDL